MCYYYGNDAVYEELGHAEVVSMELRGSSKKAADQMRVSSCAFGTTSVENCTVQGMSCGQTVPAAGLLQHMAACA